jgi:hypothetical protein
MVDTLLHPHLHTQGYLQLAGACEIIKFRTSNPFLVKVFIQNYPCWYRSRQVTHEKHQPYQQSPCQFHRAVLGPGLFHFFYKLRSKLIFHERFENYHRFPFQNHMVKSSPFNPPCVNDPEWTVGLWQEVGVGNRRGWNLLPWGSRVIRPFHRALVKVKIVWGIVRCAPCWERETSGRDRSLTWPWQPLWRSKTGKNNIKIKFKKYQCIQHT